MRALARVTAAALAMLPALPAAAESVIDRCPADRTCAVRLTPAQLLGEVQALVDAERFSEARPMLAALAQVPQYRLEYRFLTGFVAAHLGELDSAAAMYRAILTDDPTQTRVRLELARVMLMQGKSASADRMFRLAQSDGDLPPEIARTIRAARDIIRSKRAWSVNFDVGFVPDSNINQATSANAVNVFFGNQAIPLTLDQSARAKSGTGRTGSFEGSLRLPVADKMLLLADVTTLGNDYAGRNYDDFAYEAALGPEVRLSDITRVRIQGVGAQRVFGNRIATRQAGIKTALETMVSDSGRLAFQFDGRRTFARFDRDYSGWQAGLFATYEHAVARAIVASGGLFVRRDRLDAAAYSNTEAGVIAGIGGELPWGVNLGVSGTASRALFDAAVPFFSLDPRKDWRFTGRMTLGVRALRAFGFSPSITLSTGRVDSSIDYYANDRTRFRFALARYF